MYQWSGNNANAANLVVSSVIPEADAILFIRFLISAIGLEMKSKLSFVGTSPYSTELGSNPLSSSINCLKFGCAHLLSVSKGSSRFVSED